jgi:hypothetical protein
MGRVRRLHWRDSGRGGDRCGCGAVERQERDRSSSLLAVSTRNPWLDSVFLVNDDVKRLDEVRETNLARQSIHLLQ